MRVLVTGGGIGGLTSTAALRRVGADVEVADRAAAFGAVGAAFLAQGAAQASEDAAALAAALEDDVPSTLRVYRAQALAYRAHPAHVMGQQRPLTPRRRRATAAPRHRDAADRAFHLDRLI